MIHRYKNMCKEYNCKSKIYTKPVGGLKNKLGNPDLVIFFTDAMSHKMVQGAMCELKSKNPIIERSATSSISALKKILDRYVKKGER